VRAAHAPTVSATVAATIAATVAPTVSATSHGHLSASHCRQHSAARGRRDDVIAPRVRA